MSSSSSSLLVPVWSHIYQNNCLFRRERRRDLVFCILKERGPRCQQQHQPEALFTVKTFGTRLIEETEKEWKKAGYRKGRELSKGGRGGGRSKEVVFSCIYYTCMYYKGEVENIFRCFRSSCSAEGRDVERTAFSPDRGVTYISIPTNACMCGDVLTYGRAGGNPHPTFPPKD